MEGTLLKWTNYYNGWQPRYFMLDDTGILSYYKSRDLIHEGCKGSCLVVACEVKAHSYDPLRFDLIIPGEQFFSLKAKSQPERQNWLVALGSCKSRGTKSTTTAAAIATSSNNYNNTSSLSNQQSLYQQLIDFLLVSHISAIDHELKLKVQDLRLYETVLMQRAHAVKSIANDTPTPDVKKLDETTSMLSDTCDAFIHTLDECVKLATDGSTQSLLLLSPTSSINSDSISTQRKSSKEFNALPKQIIYQTFFSELQHTFSQLNSLSFNEISSELFLLTCEEYLHLIEKLNSTTFIPLRSDVNGNLNKIRKKIGSDPKKFQTLYSIIDDEISTQTTKAKDSATDALLWLKRSMTFLGCFLNEFGQGDKTVEDALNKAYGQTLKRFHGWITRGAFSIAMKSVPYNEDFLLSLAIHSNDAREVLFERQILNEMIEHSTNLNIVLRKINDFYLEQKLESNEIIG